MGGGSEYAHSAARGGYSAFGAPALQAPAAAKPGAGGQSAPVSAPAQAELASSQAPYYGQQSYQSSTPSFQVRPESGLVRVAVVAVDTVWVQTVSAGAGPWPAELPVLRPQPSGACPGQGLGQVQGSRWGGAGSFAGATPLAAELPGLCAQLPLRALGRVWCETGRTQGRAGL